MADVDGLTKTFTPEFRRERRVTQDPTTVVPQVPDDDTAPATVTLRENFEAVAAKGDKILRDAIQLAIVRRIPVPETAPDVRAAVQRQDPDSQGLFITFDLYRKAYDYLQRQTTALPLTILDELTGDPVSDRRRVSQRLREVTDDLSESAAELLGDQIVILFVLKLLQLGMDSLSDGAQSATKQPSGYELPVIALQLAISIAATQLYTGINEEKATEALEALGTGVPVPKTNLAEAREFLANTPLFQTALLQRRPGDYQTIYDYAQAFLDRQTEPGWETWQLAPELQSAITACHEASSELQRYPERQSQTELEVPDPTLEPIRAALSADVQLTNGTPVTPTPLTLRLFQRNLDSLNQAVDQLAYVLGDTIDVADLCCILQWAGVVGDRPIQLVRSLLDVRQNKLNRLAALQPATINAQVSYSTVLHQSAMMLLQDFEERAVKRIKEWFTTEPERWTELAQGCKLIDELLEFVLASLEDIEAVLESLLDRWLGHIEDREARLNSKLNQTGGQKHIRFLMTTLDQFLTVELESGFCADGVVQPLELAQAATRTLENLGPAVALPTGLTGSPYQTLQSPPVQLDNGITLPSPPGASAGQTPLDVAREVCRGGLVSRATVEFPRG